MTVPNWVAKPLGKSASISPGLQYNRRPVESGMAFFSNDFEEKTDANNQSRGTGSHEWP